MTALFINNSVPRADVGTVNGLAVSATAITRYVLLSKAPVSASNVVTIELHSKEVLTELVMVLLFLPMPIWLYLSVCVCLSDHCVLSMLYLSFWLYMYMN